MAIRKPTLYESLSLGLTSLFGLIALLGTVKIVITPTISNVLAIFTILSLFLALIGYAGHRKIKEKKNNPYCNYCMEIKADFSIRPEKIEDKNLVNAKIHVENHYKAYSNLKDRIDINRCFADNSEKGLQLFEEYGTDVRIRCDVLGEYEPSINSCQYFHYVWLSYNLKEPIKKGQKFSIIEDFDRPFKSDHLKFPTIYPSGSKNISLIFRNIKPHNAYFKKRSGQGTIEEGSIEVQEQQERIFLIEYIWKSPRIGETLFIHWSWPSTDFYME